MAMDWRYISDTIVFIWLYFVHFYNFMEDNGGVLDGQWHKFSTEQNFHLAITKTRALGGIVYDLPVKTGV